MAEHLDATWDEMLCAYILGMEVAIRLGASVQGGFHHVGFHATGIVSHFSSAVVAGKLMGLTPEQLCAAQGIAASTTSGVQAFLEEGAWTKRMHPGWGALAGITSAYMVEAGFIAPTRPYEARFGLYDTHLHKTSPIPELLAETFGKEWRMLETAIKPYPICHFSHGCTEAAIVISEQLAGRTDEIVEVIAQLPEPTLHIVAEPQEAKQRVTTDYEAKFSAQFCVAMGLLRGRFGLKELTADALKDPEVQALTRKVICEADSKSKFPKYFSGGVTLRLKDGTTLSHYVPVNKGAGDRAMSAEDIKEKFLANAQLKLTANQALATLDILQSARARSVRAVLQDLNQTSGNIYR
jgi:2-methylcitrate dehydratase PrpD